MFSQHTTQFAMATPLQSGFTRTEPSYLNPKDWLALVRQAKKLNRFYYYTIDFYGNKKSKGTHSARGPIDFNIERDFLDKQDQDTLIDVDMFETTLIYLFLVRLNAILKEINISTIKSGPAYYENDYTFTSNPCYLQNPFIEFSGDLSSIEFFKLLVKHPLLQEFMITTFQESRYNSIYMEEDDDDTKRIRVSIIRLYVNEYGEVITKFDDTLFWETVISSVEDTKKMFLESENEFDILRNDPDLDKDRDWFVYNKFGEIIKIEDKENVNPLNDFPLTTLEVRYEAELELFLKPLDTE